MKPNGELEFGEWFQLDHPEGEYPPGIWSCAGKRNGEIGVYIGRDNEIQGFVPEPQLDFAIQFLRARNNLIADLLEKIRPDVQELREGKQQLVADLTGRRLPQKKRNE